VNEGNCIRHCLRPLTGCEGSYGRKKGHLRCTTQKRSRYEICGLIEAFSDGKRWNDSRNEETRAHPAGWVAQHGQDGFS